MDTLSASFDSPNPVPEPGTMALLGMGALGILRRCRRRSAPAGVTQPEA